MGYLSDYTGNPEKDKFIPMLAQYASVLTMQDVLQIAVDNGLVDLIEPVTGLLMEALGYQKAIPKGETRIAVDVLPSYEIDRKSMWQLTREMKAGPCKPEDCSDCIFRRVCDYESAFKLDCDFERVMDWSRQHPPKTEAQIRREAEQDAERKHEQHLIDTQFARTMAELEEHIKGTWKNPESQKPDKPNKKQGLTVGFYDREKKEFVDGDKN